jgi:hypothetical protein
MNHQLVQAKASVTDFARGAKEHLARERKMDMELKATLKATLEAYARSERGRPLNEVFADLGKKHFPVGV